MQETYWLTNVRLETEYVKENDFIVKTKTKNFNLLIENGKINQIVPGDSEIKDSKLKVDGRSLLALPSFKEMHCHLDKTLLGDEWRAVKPVKNIIERVEIEKQTLPKLNTTTTERAKVLLNKQIKYGITHVRTHVDIYPEVGLANLIAVKEALSSFSGSLSSEIVAFAQHGFLKDNTVDLIREAISHGVDFIGSVDPGVVDNNIEESLQTLVQLASEGNVGIDIHIHDPNELGAHTIKRLAELTIEAGLQGRVAVSHGFGIGDIPREKLAELIPLFQKAEMMFISSVPLDREFPPLEYLRDNDVAAAVGCDNIFDSWNPFNNGDILERAGRLAQTKRWYDEYALSQTLFYITGGITPLNQRAEKVWPKIGDTANIVLVDATCSAETIARRSNRLATIYQGNITYNNLG